MTEPTPETEPANPAPEPTPLELVAQLAAEAAAAARPDPSPRLQALEEQLGQVLQALAAAAGPDGNAARIAARLDTAEARLEDLTARTAAPPARHPEQQRQIDDLRLRLADLERTTS